MKKELKKLVGSMHVLIADSDRFKRMLEKNDELRKDTQIFICAIIGKDTDSLRELMNDEIRKINSGLRVSDWRLGNGTAVGELDINFFAWQELCFHGGMAKEKIEACFYRAFRKQKVQQAIVLLNKKYGLIFVIKPKVK